MLIVATLLGGFFTTVQAQERIRGRVLDAVVRTPVVAAQVRAGAEGSVALTDADGHFELTVSAGRTELRVERVGYTTLRRTVDRPNAALTLLLEPDAAALDALVVTASRRLQRLADAPVTTELITRREIEETGAADVAGVLFERTGIELEGGHPVGAGAMLQGFGTERVLILLDGQPLPGRIAGNFDLSRMPASLLERVEVVKGPQSTLFGSDAMGGVINLITRRPDRALDVSGQVLGGSQGRLDASGRAQGTLLGSAVLADAGRRRIELTPGQAGTAADALSERWDGMFKLQRRHARGDLELSALLVDEQQRWASGQLYNFSDNRQLAVRANGSWQHGSHRIAPTLYLSDFTHLSRRSNSINPPEVGEEETQRIAEAEVLYSLSAGEHTLDAGVELRQESIESARVLERTRSLDALEGFTQFTLLRGPFSIVPGVRFSNSEAWGAHWTPRLALLFRPVESLALRASTGSAFRAPAFKELYIRFANIAPGANYVVNGNPDLQPETSINLSLGAEFTRNAWYARVQSFYNSFDQFIETVARADSSGLSVFTYGNIQDGSTRGLELEAGTQWRAARVELGYSFLSAVDHATDQPLLGRPRHAGRLLLGYSTPFGARVNVTGVHTGSTPLQRDPAGTIDREAFTRFDVRVAQTILQRIEVSLGLDNVLDQTPGAWPGFTGRQIYGGISWRLGTQQP